MHLRAIKFLILLGMAHPVLADPSIPRSVEPFFKQYCYSCHDEFSAKGDLNLEGMSRKITNTTDAQHWQDILDQMNSGEMPPKITKSKKKLNSLQKVNCQQSLGL